MGMGLIGYGFLGERGKEAFQNDTVSPSLF
jgi:hypothetical protein